MRALREDAKAGGAAEAARSDDSQFNGHVAGVVRQSAEQPLSGLLDAESEAICDANPEDVSAGRKHRRPWRRTGDLFSRQGDTLVLPADHLGTVRDLASYDAQNDITTIANHRVYNAFGERTSQTNAEVKHLFGFTGHPLDEDTGFQNNLNRWYDPGVGRWLSEDPIGFGATDANLCRYCGNTPTIFVDPSGGVKSADGTIAGWGKVHADLGTLEQVLRAELVNDRGAVEYFVWQNYAVGGMPAVAFADRMIQAYVDPTTRRLKRGYTWRFVLASAADFHAKFEGSGKGSCPYWVQFASATMTKGGKPTVKPWSYDGSDLSNKDYPKINRYSNVYPQKGIAEIWDRPGRTFELNPTNDITQRSVHDQVGNAGTVFILGAGVLQGNPQFQQDVQDKYAVEMNFQTYLVNPDTHSPLGYFSWGVTITVRAAGPDPVVTDLKWTAGFDANVWKDLAVETNTTKGDGR